MPGVLPALAVQAMRRGFNFWWASAYLSGAMLFVLFMAISLIAGLGMEAYALLFTALVAGLATYGHAVYQLAAMHLRHEMRFEFKRQIEEATERLMGEAYGGE